MNKRCSHKRTLEGLRQVLAQIKRRVRVDEWRMKSRCEECDKPLFFNSEGQVKYSVRKAQDVL